MPTAGIDTWQKWYAGAQAFFEYVAIIIKVSSLNVQLLLSRFQTVSVDSEETWAYCLFQHLGWLVLWGAWQIRVISSWLRVVAWSNPDVQIWLLKWMEIMLCWTLGEYIGLWKWANKYVLNMACVPESFKTEPLGLGNKSTVCSL